MDAHCTVFFFNDTATTEIYTLSLHDALPIFSRAKAPGLVRARAPGLFRAEAPGLFRGEARGGRLADGGSVGAARSEEHTSELQSRQYFVCRLLLEKKYNRSSSYHTVI